MKSTPCVTQTRIPAHLLLCIALGTAASGPAQAQSWKPTRPIALVVGAAPGGSIDLTARIIQKIWDDHRTVGLPVIVINKPGAGNGIARSFLNERGGDGHAIAIGTTNLVTNPVIGSHAIGHRDVTPLAILFDDYFVLLVRPDSPLKSMADMQQSLRADSAALAIGFGPGMGAGSHTAAAVAVKSLGIDVKGARFVPYKSAGEAIAAMLGGQIDVVSATAANAPPFLSSGRLRAIGLIAPQRLTGALASVTTMKEQGFDAVFTNWRAVIGPKGMRREHIAYWEHALAAVNESEAWKKELTRNFWKANFLHGQAAKQFIERQAEEFRALWAEIGVKKL